MLGSNHSLEILSQHGRYLKDITAGALVYPTSPRKDKRAHTSYPRSHIEDAIRPRIHSPNARIPGWNTMGRTEASTPQNQLFLQMRKLPANWCLQDTRRVSRFVEIEQGRISKSSGHSQIQFEILVLLHLSQIIHIDRRTDGQLPEQVTMRKPSPSLLAPTMSLRTSSCLLYRHPQR